MRINIENHKDLQSELLLGIAHTIARAGGEVRIVGGAVRDVLLGRTIKDIDLAVNMEPAQAQAILEKVGYKVVPTGIKFGTIMVVEDGKGYEMTSLRRDIETDGRHAIVHYTCDWQEDAQRRDFTINGLYLDFSGQIYDFVGGLDDMESKTLRFIGLPEERIKEDALRILRYFRFLSELGEDVAVDHAALQACREMAYLISTLSAERVWQEVSRLLLGAAATRSARLMAQEGIWEQFLPQVQDIDRFAALRYRDNALLSLASLLRHVDDELFVTLRLSHKEQKKLRQWVELVIQLRVVSTAKALRQYLYANGKEAVVGSLRLLDAEGVQVKDWFAVAEVWEPVRFPLSGKDIQDKGVYEGREIGRLLSEVESWWRGEDFMPSYKECLLKLEMLMHTDRR